MDPVTLPLVDFADGRKPGAPILVQRADGAWCSGIYLADDWDRNWCSVWIDGGLHVVALTSCALNLHHPNGERIARACFGGQPDTSIADLAALRDRVLAGVSA